MEKITYTVEINDEIPSGRHDEAMNKLYELEAKMLEEWENYLSGIN